MSEYNLCGAHDWKDIDSISGRDVVCTKCGCPGTREEYPDGHEEVYWPAT